MSRQPSLLFRRCGMLLVLMWACSVCDLSRAGSPQTRPLTKEQCATLCEEQPVVADVPIFDGQTFPKIDFADKDLVAAALGTYTLTVRFFDADYNEIQKPTPPGRYGAWVEIHFANGTSDTRHLTLFKTGAPYLPAKDPFGAPAQFPAAFGLSKEVLDREQWNTEDATNRAMEGEAHHYEKYPILVAALHDFAADPARWHGFSYWRIDDAWWAGLEKKLGESQDYPHLVALPPDYGKNPGQHWPLILFLHGSGERGSDLKVLKDQGPQRYISHGHPLPFIVVSPQCPKGEAWRPDRLMGLLDQIEATYRVDPKRIYVTGLSLGGYGTFDLAATCPERIAAIAPLSGGDNPDIADRIKSVPAWIIHGAEDPTVPARYSVAIADRLKALGAEVKLTIHPNEGHGDWNKTYADPALYAWFLQHSLK